MEDRTLGLEGMGRFLTALMLLPFVLATPAAATDEGVEYIEDLWEDAIESEEYQEASGDTTHYPTDWPSAPEGIYGYTLKSNGDSCNWCWVHARAVDNEEIKRWVHTSMWAENQEPWLSCFYVVNRNADYLYVPRNHAYYMSAFRWHPPYPQRVPPQPVEEPDNPAGRISAYVSGVYITEEYGNPPGGTLQQVCDISLGTLVNW
jgi:hypothetical protein